MKINVTPPSHKSKEKENQSKSVLPPFQVRYRSVPYIGDIKYQKRHYEKEKYDNYNSPNLWFVA